MSDVIEKVIRTTEIGAGGGGLLNPEQSDRFIDYMFDATVLGNGRNSRTYRMRSNTAEIDKIGIGKRLMRKATEAVDDGVNAGVSFSKISLTTSKLRLDWELSTESLEDNIEGEDLEDHIARLMATQAGNDLEDLAINGDTTSGDALISTFDGWHKQAVAGGHVIDAGGDPLTRAVANAAIKAMPRIYKQRRGDMRFYTGTNLLQDYVYSLSTGLNNAGGVPEGIVEGAFNGAGAIQGAAGYTGVSLFGIPVVEVPLFNETKVGTYTTPTGEHGDLELTFPQNRIWAVKREIKIYREFKNKKDTIEYTMYTRVGTAIENVDAYVVVRNLKVAA